MDASITNLDANKLLVHLRNVVRVREMGNVVYALYLDFSKVLTRSSMIFGDKLMRSGLDHIDIDKRKRNEYNLFSKGTAN